MVPCKFFLSKISVVLAVSISIASVTTLASALPDQVFWDNDWPSDLEVTDAGDDLLEATVLFAQAQVMPSKNGIPGDQQPRLTALRKSLVMVKPHDDSDGITMTVRDADGNVVSGSDIAMEDPEDIPKQYGWIDVGEDLPTFPSSLDSPYVVQGQSNLNEIGDDEDATGLTDILNDDDKTPTNEVKIRTWDGSWVRDIYLPEGSTVPSDSKIQVVCDSGYAVSVFYHNPQTGGWRTRRLTRGDKLMVVLTETEMWIASDDLEHTDYVFGHNFYSAILDLEWVKPGMTLEFAASNGKRGILEADVGGETELTITTIDAGFLTEPRDEFTFKDDFTTHPEYFETTMTSRLVVVQYESMHFTEIVLPDGKKYDTLSDDEGGVYEGDMRQFIGKLLISHGTDLANYGISSSWAQTEQPHTNTFTCAFLAAHNTVGMYQNGEVVHGLSGGNGMITLVNSIGNEFSHEVGHNYGMGHYPGQFSGSVHRAANEINSSWGWDSRSNTFVPNFASSNSGDDQCYNGSCQSAFMDRYKYGTDSMAGGSPLWGNRYTMYTPYVMKRIQNFLESKARWDPSSSTGFRKYSSTTGQMEEYVNLHNGQKVPRLYRVPVTTLVGYYDPDEDRALEAYIYPALHGAYGFVYDDDDVSTTGTLDGCELVVETKTDTLAFTLMMGIDHKGMNKFHVNLPTEEEPSKASIYCYNELQFERELSGPTTDLKFTVTGAPLADLPDSTDSPTTSPTPKPTKKCKDKKLKWGPKKKDCKWVGDAKKKKWVKKRCKEKWKGEKIHWWCPKTCGKVGIGKCKKK